MFGGGHVVLPLLQASVVPPGWVDNDAFLAGYGAAQAVSWPFFTSGPSNEYTSTRPEIRKPANCLITEAVGALDGSHR